MLLIKMDFIYLKILFLVIITLVLILLQFKKSPLQIQVEMMLYSLSHLCFIAAFVSLRIHKPDVPRPLRAPGGVRTALLMQLPAVLPFRLATFTLIATRLATSYELTSYKLQATSYRL